MKVTTLVPWFGSNRTLAHTVGEALKGCRWVGVPFAGGMSELVHIDAPSIVVNDTHRHVINLATCLGDERIGPMLYRRLRRLPFHPDVLEESQGWGKALDPLRDYRDPDSAFWYFVSQWMGRSAKSGTSGEFNGGLPIRWNANGGDSNTRYRSAVKAIVAWRRILQRCNFSTLDCFDFLEKCNDEPGHGIYCDPPFPGPGDKYKHTFTEEQHRRLAGVLSGFTKTRVVCRFYDHPLVRELYPEPYWSWSLQSGAKKQSGADAPEVLLVRTLDTVTGLF